MTVSFNYYSCTLPGQSNNKMKHREYNIFHGRFSALSSFSSVNENTSPIYVTIEPKQLTFHDDPETSSVLLRIMFVCFLHKL